MIGIAGLPVAVSIAILRYRLYEIDLLINRTLVYGALTTSLVAVYVVSIVVLQGLLRALTGQESQLAIVASTLMIAALFQPLRRRIQSFNRSALLPSEVRREEDPGGLLCQPAQRNGPGRAGRRSGRGSKGDDATGPRLLVATPRDDYTGWADRLATVMVCFCPGEENVLAGRVFGRVSWWILS